MTTTFIVTGASGYIGRAVATALRDRGQVTGLSRRRCAPPGVVALAHDLAEPLPSRHGDQLGHHVGRARQQRSRRLEGYSQGT